MLSLLAANATKKDFRRVSELLKFVFISDGFRNCANFLRYYTVVFGFESCWWLSYFSFSQPGIRCFNVSSYILWFAWVFRNIHCCVGSIVFRSFARLVLRWLCWDPGFRVIPSLSKGLRAFYYCVSSFGFLIFARFVLRWLCWDPQFRVPPSLGIR